MAPSKIIRYGMWQIPVKAEGVLCGDGKRRVARIIGQPDTVWTIPASVSVKGKTVSGFISHRGYSSDTALDLAFHPYLRGVNAHLLPEPVRSTMEA